MKNIVNEFRAGFLNSDKTFQTADNYSLKDYLNMKFIGELAALATSFFFAMTILIFTTTGRMVSAQIKNLVRLVFALT